MQANILPLHTPSAPGVGLKGQNIFFLKLVLLHIRSEWIIEHHSRTYFDLGQKIKNMFFFSESSHVAYQIKENGA